MSNKPDACRPAIILLLAASLLCHAAISRAAATAQEASGPSVSEVPPARPLETVDQYARRLLERRLAEPAPAAQAQRRPNAGNIGPAQFELIYIAGIEPHARALVRIDKRYTKLVGGGDALAGWMLSTIGDDYVDIYKDDEQARIYLFSSRAATSGS